jgi:ABC-2 type transport system ATP-binding protein
VMSSRSLRGFIKRNLSQEAGKTVLYTTHYVEEASQICDRIGILDRGRLVACNAPDAIRGIVKKEEVVEIRATAVTEAHVEALKCVEGVTDVTSEVEDSVLGRRRLRLHLKTMDALPMVLDYFLKKRIRLIGLRHEEPTLEDAFIELTGRGLED